MTGCLSPMSSCDRVALLFVDNDLVVVSFYFFHPSLLISRSGYAYNSWVLLFLSLKYSNSKFYSTFPGSVVDLVNVFEVGLALRWIELV